MVVWRGIGLCFFYGSAFVFLAIDPKTGCEDASERLFSSGRKKQNRVRNLKMVQITDYRISATFAKIPISIIFKIFDSFFP